MISLKIVEAPKRAMVKKVIISPSLVGKIICISGIFTTYIMPDGKMEIVSCLNMI